MNPRRLFRQYAAERRAQAILGFHLDVLPHLSRYTALEPGMGGIVAFADLSPGEEVSRVREQVAYFRDRGQPFEWKVYDFDRPTDLRTILEQEGFTEGTREGFMVLPLNSDRPPAPPDPARVRIVRAASEEGVGHIVAVQQAVWGRDFSWLAAVLGRTLRERPDEIVLLCAYLGERPIGTGWMDVPPRSSFADLHGGAVLAELRGQGVYSLLFHERCEEARRCGYRYLAVDAAPMSRPILERKGFEFVCHTYPMRRAAQA